MSRDVLTAADLPLLRDGVILANAGHFPVEIDAEGLIGAGEVAASRQYADDLLTLELTDGRRVHLISRGHRHCRRHQLSRPEVPAAIASS